MTVIQCQPWSHPWHLVIFLLPSSQETSITRETSSFEFKFRYLPSSFAATTSLETVTAKVSHSIVSPAERVLLPRLSPLLWGHAQKVRCLLGKCEDLNSDSQNPHKAGCASVPLQLRQTGHRDRRLLRNCLPVSLVCMAGE